MTIQTCTDSEIKILQAGLCPDCHHSDFLQGPSAGHTDNIQCDMCGSRFNVGHPLVYERIGYFNKHEEGGTTRGELLQVIRAEMGEVTESWVRSEFNKLLSEIRRLSDAL